ncbi:MAG: glucose 1-dehydrogenase [Pseudomonadales bacterium]|jgi:NAD(P)-dependent dehydrogenase (short-subunit alcohol dehydrogenase family)|nr:glucose 1-dehydrogenase [Pseudomonadales bacterium]MDP7356970.1 glucose 1-dehydrogenase [Pseudomonadales bacterium]|tara:strand:- start:88 stop:861 length:774 start_codon:yes stop_codon:yes gene_type:complete
MMGRVQDKVAIVTGGSAGIGRACAITLAGEGASVAVTDVQDPEGDAVVAEINTAGGKAIYLHHDVTSEAEWQTVLEQILQEYKHLDILVNNAGIAISSPITQLSLEDFQRQNAVNLDGVFLGLKHCIPAMTESGGGSIINMSSVAGLKASPNLSAYSMTKGGVRLLSKSVARECIQANTNIRVNSVHPGIIQTAIWDKMGLIPGANTVDVDAIAKSTVPGGKLGFPEDIANGVLFLASDESSYMTGMELVIDHGFSA